MFHARRFVALLVITSATAVSLGLTLRTPTQLEANDISRWCTVWSLVERGTYRIDECLRDVPLNENFSKRLREAIRRQGADKVPD